MLHVVLLQVDEGRHAVAGLRQQIELVDLPGAQEHLAAFPGHAAVEQGLRKPQPVHDLERALGPAHGLAAEREAAGRIDDDAALPLLGEIDGGEQPTGPPPTITIGWCAGCARSWSGERVWANVSCRRRSWRGLRWSRAGTIPALSGET
jgi:hypothetical protein